MVERKEVKLDELFIRAIRNSKRSFGKMETGQLRQYFILSEKEYYAYLEKEFTITCEFIDRFYYKDEQLLGLFILKWS